ncbi:hypothetical protein BpHYR1_009455 [Brachionus plicatilis]|uniref:Uncharacterized protein n=1 Tax=Brachionus plicatilis TaxID=10195 RepID=A0A3M7QDI1_BRAPC|nr:hypothetical protein BpHYR1_009455 [Brachionus plicatilis]
MFLALHTFTSFAFSQKKQKLFQLARNAKEKDPKKQKAALFYQNDCDLDSSENESDLEQAVVEQEPPSELIVDEKAYVADATVEATVDLPRKR